MQVAATNLQDKKENADVAGRFSNHAVPPESIDTGVGLFLATSGPGSISSFASELFALRYRWR